MLLLAAFANFPQRLAELCRLQLLDSQQLLILVLIKFVALNCLLLTSPAQRCAALRGDQALVWLLRRWLTCAGHVLRMRLHRNKQQGEMQAVGSGPVLGSVVRQRKSWRCSLIYK